MTKDDRGSRILIVDDDEDMTALLKSALEGAGFRCLAVGDLESARRALETQAFDAVLLDLRLGNDDGLEIIPSIIERSPFTKIIVMTGYGSVDLAVEAMERGATTFLTKSGDPRRIVEELARRLEASHESSDMDLETLTAAFGIIGKSREIMAVVDEIDRIKDAEANVLITGESGTGKELVARAIHWLSARRGGPFEAINCSAVPETLLESELFGHRRGAFTDAKTDRTGIFEVCSKGTLLLDEIGEMPLHIQAKILRVLQEREIRPLGSSTTVRVDTRVIAATNRDLETEVRAGRFREDLYYRLSVIPIHLPPLRERTSDIPLLVEHFVKKFNDRYKRDVVLPSKEIMTRLVAYDWPGNIRELQNALERAVVLSRDGKLHLEHIFMRQQRIEGAKSGVGGISSIVYSEAKEDFEKTYLRKILGVARGNISEAARISGRFRSDIYRLMDKYGITQDEFKSG